MKSRLGRQLVKKGNRDKNSSSPGLLALCHHAVKNSSFIGLDRNREGMSMEGTSVWSLVRTD